MLGTRGRRLAVAWIALAAVALVSLAGAILGGASSSAPRARVAGLEREVRCPSCGNLSVYNAKTASAYSIAAFIRREVAAGQSNQEIIDALVASYGDTILMSPPASGVGLYLWTLPALVAAGIGYEVYRSLGRERGPEGRSRRRRAPERKTGLKTRRVPKVSRSFAFAGGALVLVGLGGLATLALLPAGGPAVGSELAAAETLASLGAVKPALQEFNRVLSQQPHNSSALAYKGWLEFNASTAGGSRAAAIALMARAARYGPGDAHAQLFLGLALFYGRGEAMKGAALLDRFLADRPQRSLLVEAAPLARPVFAAAHRKIPAALGVEGGVTGKVPRG